MAEGHTVEDWLAAEAELLDGHYTTAADQPKRERNINGKWKELTRHYKGPMSQELGPGEIPASLLAFRYRAKCPQETHRYEI